MARVPLPHSYWLEPGRILAGEHPWGGSEAATLGRVRQLLEAGLDCFVDLTEPGEQESYERLLADAAGGRDVQYLRKPLRDHGVPESTEAMREILDALDHALADGRRIYLHCRAGIGRTNTVAGCWITERCGSGDAALERLNRLWLGNARSRSWPTVPETDEQGDFVRYWQAPRGMLASAVPASAVPASAVPASAVIAAHDRRDRVRGLLIGLAAGDALGHAVHGLPAGAWADKTAMALCLAESLVARDGHDAHDQVERYQDWQRSGRWSSTGTCVGISTATSRALASAQWTGNPYAGSHDPAHADAEPLARIGPAVAWHPGDARAAIDAAVNCARITHQAPLTLDAVQFLAALLAGALAGADKPALLAPHFTPAPDGWDSTTLRPPIGEIAGGAWRGRRPRRMLRGRFLAAAALESALAAFEEGADLAQCLRVAASRPGDAPTATAIVGQLAGAHYGASSLPPEWRDTLARVNEIEALADSLSDAGGRARAG